MNNWIDSYRVCIFVPEFALEEFIKIVAPAIPSFLGSYDHVCWWEAGTEQSRHKESKTIKQIRATRFEFSIPAQDALLNKIINDSVLPAHPWEEPVILVTKQQIFEKK